MRPVEWQRYVTGYCIGKIKRSSRAFKGQYTEDADCAHGSPCGGAFFSLRAQRKESKERAARPLRLPRSPRCGTGRAKTRCAQTICPFAPVPHPTARLSGKGPIIPEWFLSNLTTSRRGERFWELVSFFCSNWLLLLSFLP